MIAVDTKQLYNLGVKLINVHRAAMPNAVRFTLNDIAFDVKKNTLLPALSKSDMIIRSESFFKKYSGVDKATGWDIDRMQAEVGMIPSGNASKAVSRLKEQEEGGTLPHYFVPDIQARTGGTRRGKVRAPYRHARMNLRARVRFGDKQRLIREVAGTRIASGGAGRGNVIIYGSVLYEIRGFKRMRKSDTIKLHLKKLYTFRQGRKVHLKPQRFMEKAAMTSGQKLQEIFNSNAERQLKKFSNR